MLMECIKHMQHPLLAVQVFYHGLLILLILAYRSHASRIWRNLLEGKRGALADDPLLSMYFSGSSDSSHSIFSASFGPIVTKWLLKASAISLDLSIL